MSLSHITSFSNIHSFFLYILQILYFNKNHYLKYLKTCVLIILMILNLFSYFLIVLIPVNSLILNYVKNYKIYSLIGLESFFN